MVEYHLNEDPYCSGLEKYGVQVVVTDYETGDYCGSGDALLLYEDNTVMQISLSHCSCYGPMEDGERKSGEMTLEQFREQNAEVTSPWSDKLGAKFLELVDGLAT